MSDDPNPIIWLTVPNKMPEDEAEYVVEKLRGTQLDDEYEIIVTTGGFDLLDRDEIEHMIDALQEAIEQ